MTIKKRSPLERKIQADIEADLGAEPDLLLLRNAIGDAEFFDDEGGIRARVKFGLGEGSPDLVAILRAVVPPDDSRDSMYGQITLGVWFCLEVKTDDGVVSGEQKKCHEIWRRFGALVYVVRSVEAARTALLDARRRINHR